MPIEHLSDHEVSQLEARIVASQGAGQDHSLSAVLSVKLSRQAPDFSGRDVTRLILAKSQESHDGLVTYKELWQSCYPGMDWQGQNSVNKIKKILGNAVNYCLDHELPIVTSIVVRTDSRDNSAKAKDNMFEATITRRILPPGMGPETFVTREKTATRQMSPYTIP